ncbi:MAG: T9SS type A sorting domain-containing protein [bacterium]|nr:T9SS type A sorting domain-containing protein [bacterium]
MSHFEIDRDGSSMAHVAATNNASGHNYTWLDKEVSNGQTYSYTLTSVDLDGSRTVLGTVEATPQAEVIPSEFMLAQNYPNPFNASTTIEYSLPEATDVSLKLFNLAGQEVAVLASGAHAAGRHVVSLNANDLSSGIYFYRLESPMRSIQQKMILLK